MWKKFGLGETSPQGSLYLVTLAEYVDVETSTSNNLWHWFLVEPTAEEGIS